MRKFKLFSADMTDVADLTQPSMLAHNPSGLGISQSNSFNDTSAGKFITGKKLTFDPIKLSICFNGDGSSGYRNYKDLADFLARRGKEVFLIEYDDGVAKKYADVVLKSLTKTEVQENGAFVETLTLERLTMYFLPGIEMMQFDTSAVAGETFPLSFPLRFRESASMATRTLENGIDEPMPLSIECALSSYADDTVIAVSGGGTTMTMKIKGAADDAVVRIDPIRKKITETKNGVVSNGYDLTNKAFRSFLFIPKGVYTVAVTIAGGVSGMVRLTYRRYVYD